MPMKSIRNTLNIVLSAIIVALGFGSCVSHRAYQGLRPNVTTSHRPIKQLPHLGKVGLL